MRYFQDFPKIDYSMLEATGGVYRRVTRTVPNMTARLALDIQNDRNLEYETYRIVDTDRPDTIAAQMYGAARYAWVIMLSNNMRDWYDWPLTDNEFLAYMNAKYETSAGANDGYDASKSIVHERIWTTTDGQELVVDETAYNELSPAERSMVTKFTHEYDANDAKRSIKIPSLASLPTIIQQFADAVSR